MRKWRSHKIVEAERIVGVGPNSCALADGTDCTVPSNFFARGTPQPDDYLVRYADGYMSWSPKKAFEDGYTEVLV